MRSLMTATALSTAMCVAHQEGSTLGALQTEAAPVAERAGSFKTVAVTSERSGSFQTAPVTSTERTFESQTTLSKKSGGGSSGGRSGGSGGSGALTESQVVSASSGCAFQSQASSPVTRLPAPAGGAMAAHERIMCETFVRTHMHLSAPHGPEWCAWMCT